MLKRNQKIHTVNKGTLGNNRKQRKKRKQNETKIEIEISKNQINNINNDIQSYNDNEITNRKRINEAFDEQHDEEEQMEDDSGEETDSNVPDLINRLDDPEDQNRASDSESDSEIDNDEEQKQRNQGDPMEVKVGYMKGMDGIFKEKNNSHNKTRKMGKTLYDRVVDIFKREEPEAKMNPTQYPKVTKNKSSLYKNKDIKYNNNKKKKKKKGRSRVQIPSESDDEYNSKEDDDESVSDLPGLQHNRLDSESEE